MAIIDSQVHVYEANTPQRPWHSVPNWPDHVTGDEMVTAMDKVGVDGAIFIWFCRKFCSGGAEGAAALLAEGIMRPGRRTVRPQ
jgi:hypothetical protein